jgi:hypothetical protein
MCLNPEFCKRLYKLSIFFDPGIALSVHEMDDKCLSRIRTFWASDLTSDRSDQLFGLGQRQPADSISLFGDCNLTWLEVGERGNLPRSRRKNAGRTDPGS